MEKIKNIIIIVILFMSITSFAQTEANNFLVTSENKVNWQKIYENKSVSFEDLVNTVRSNIRFKDVQIYDDKITFLGEGIPTDPKAVGFSRGGTSFYALGDIRAFFTIDYKPGRYRITAINISTPVPAINMLMPVASNYEFTDIEESVLSKDGFKKTFIKKESLIMNHAIEAQFQLVKQSNEEW